jgi:uncharacterized membrane protein SirB2
MRELSLPRFPSPQPSDRSRASCAPANLGASLHGTEWRGGSGSTHCLAIGSVRYAAMLKTIHVACAFLSISGYMLRGVLMLRDSPLLNARWVRTVPHVVDTVLLLSAIGLVYGIRQYPFVHGWLTAKVLALVVYIVLGAIGLRYGRTKTIRTIAWLGAILTFAYIVAVARSRQPLLGLL